ncbi:MAG TPA: tRNA (adenosine(37)-N6)-dimethylallyltransferase MiaA, partial [Gammaproteobacteria bacterium]|nr:tRNA (adenosine(37)-N6)-dimethylallyltransferase MiaA [Gammaproteobacteria bacterium]
PVVAVVGPTASGKSGLAVEVALALGGEVFNADAFQLYRGMDVGTAKPGRDVLAVAPHKLIDILDPAESYSAARFRADALAAMDEIRAAGRIPLLTGGTMLYFDALQHGLSELPSADPGLRAELERRLAAEGSSVLHAELMRLDPIAAARIHPNDPQRIQRALEVCYISGRPLSELQGRRRVESGDYRYMKLALIPGERPLLHEIIERRFRSMMSEGFLGEVVKLRARGDLYGGLPSMRAVGYRQLWQHLDGEFDLPEAVRRGVVATRRYAKRQLTWLRSEPDVNSFDSYVPRFMDDVLAFVERSVTAAGV